MEPGRYTKCMNEEASIRVIPRTNDHDLPSLGPQNDAEKEYSNTP